MKQFTVQGARPRHSHEDQPTIFIRETKKRASETRYVVGKYASEALEVKGEWVTHQRVKDHVGDIWYATFGLDGNYVAAI